MVLSPVPAVSCHGLFLRLPIQAFVNAPIKALGGVDEKPTVATELNPLYPLPCGAQSMLDVRRHADPDVTPRRARSRGDRTDGLDHLRIIKLPEHPQSAGQIVGPDDDRIEARHVEDRVEI